MNIELTTSQKNQVAAEVLRREFLDLMILENKDSFDEKYSVTDGKLCAYNHEPYDGLVKSEIRDATEKESLIYELYVKFSGSEFISVV